MAQIIWSAPASFDLIAIIEYIELDNISAALKLAKKVDTQVQKLSLFPKMGKAWDGLADPPLRLLVVSPCKIFYRENSKTITIVAVARMERDVTRFL